MSIGALRYDQVAFKAVHNSIDRKYTILEQLAGRGGVAEPCCGLELDIHQDEDRFEWTVKHGAGDVGTPLRTVLNEIAGWSRRNPKHTVLTIHLDLKNQPGDDGAFADAIDALLVGVFGTRRIYGPGRVIGDRADLVRGARGGGWATLDELAGKVVFCLSGKARRKQAYAGNSPLSRRCFADFPGSQWRPAKGERVFANMFVEAKRYRESLKRFSDHAGFITRGYSIVRAATWRTSVDGSLNLLSTDVLDQPQFSLGGKGVKALTKIRHVR